jgi:hypothetical protein
MLIFRTTLTLLFVSMLAPISAVAQTAAPAAAASPAAAATVDPKIEALAKEWLDRVQTGNIDRSQFTDQMNAALTPALVKQVSAQLAPLGKPTAFAYVGSQTVQGSMVYEFRVTFASVQLNEDLAIDAAGKISGLRFTPAQ